jgi:hypothetical protein
MYTVKKFAIFPSPAGMSLIKLSLDGNNSLIKLSLDGNNLIIPAQEEFDQ